ncbi:MAG TPA: DinB family protein [Gemmatimonadaceae bacterium]|nr:DinB family protein [Gemmatimonadaceae bacterium]
MRRAISVAAAVLLAAPAVARSQTQPTMPTAGPLSAALVSAWQRASVNMPGAADAMPADKFSFKPTPAQMSFGEILAHESQSNETLCAAVAGGQQTPSESAAGATAPKEQLVARLRKSFEVCGAIVAKLPESALGDSVPYFGGRKATKARAAIALAQDWADHYAQAAMYLRLNGILPPSARPR